ncbi:hypothetical protein ACR6C2_19835 [Streptomyces sp. INA 01156]
MAWRRWLLVGLAAVLTACSGPDRTPGDRNAAIEGTWQSAGYGYVFDIARDGAGRPGSPPTTGRRGAASAGTRRHRWAVRVTRRPSVRTVRSSCSSTGRETG